MESAVNVYGLSHVDVPVSDLDRSLCIYRGLLGFTELSRTGGRVDLDAGGTIVLRLIEGTRTGHRVSLRVQTQTVESLHEALVREGCPHVHEALRTPEQELVACVRDPDSHTLYVWRPLTEDEYDFVPPLPKQLTWAQDAEALLKSLLRSIPAPFRALARWKIVRVAENLAARTCVVTREEAVRGFILASPRIARERNRPPLVAHGIEVQRYEADWAAD